MTIKNSLPLVLASLALLLPINLFAEMTWRCNGVNHATLTQADSDGVAANLGSNCARIQLGFDAEMDGLSGEAFKDRLHEEIESTKEAIEMFSRSGMKTLVSFYSPPGGFETRNAPAHHQMFSQSSLQSEYLAAIELIVTELGDNPAVLAIDLNNEPAVNSDLLCTDCKPWEELVIDAVAVARTANPAVKLIVKSTYGDSNRLRRLPFFNDQNVVYGYHYYFAPEYQHTGIYRSDEFVAKPKAKKLRRSFDTKFVAFARAWQKKRNVFLEASAGLIDPATVPEKAELFMTETAVSNLAADPEQFITETLENIESVGRVEAGPKLKLRKLKKKCLRKGNQRKKNSCLRRLKIKKKLKLIDQYLSTQGWSWHILYEAPVWDCRNIQVRNKFVTVGYDTKMCQALKRGFDG